MIPNLEHGRITNETILLDYMNNQTKMYMKNSKKDINHSFKNCLIELLSIYSIRL